MKKRRKPKEILESQKNPHLEHAYIKYPGEEMQYVTTKQSEKEVSYKILEATKGKSKKYTHIHNHPTKRSDDHLGAIPSSEDYQDFLSHNEKAMMISQQDKDTGEELGRTFVRKTKKTPKKILKVQEKELSRRLKIYDEKISSQKKKNMFSFREKPLDAFNIIGNGYNLQHRFVPSKGNEFNPNFGTFRKKKTKNLWSKAISVFFLFGIVFLLDKNLTGFAILDTTASLVSPTGILVVLAFLGIIAYFGIKKKYWS